MFEYVGMGKGAIVSLRVIANQTFESSSFRVIGTFSKPIVWSRGVATVAGISSNFPVIAGDVPSSKNNNLALMGTSTLSTNATVTVSIPLIFVE